MLCMGKFRSAVVGMVGGGGLLLLAVILALLVSNSPYGDLYRDVLCTRARVSFAFLTVDLDVQGVVNDCLMTLFFLMVAIDIKREILIGDLSTNSQRLLSVIASTSGVIVPALLYYAVNYGQSEVVCGWAIPTGTDIAFMLGVLSLVKRRIPRSLRVFATASVIIDDVIAVLLIALFYTQNLDISYLLGILACVIVLIVLNFASMRSRIVYAIMGTVLWYCCYRSGIHATISGVLLGLFMPMDALRDEVSKHSEKSCGIKFLSSIVSYIIVPIFAFVNSGIKLSDITLSTLSSTVTIGVMFGLFFGKQVGIFCSAMLLIKAKFVKMPSNSTIFQLYAVSVLCGIGFTMTLFVATLAFETSVTYLLEAKVGMMLGSFVSFVVGVLLLYISQAVQPLSRQRA